MKTGNALSSAITHISCIALCLVLTLALLLASAAAETETRIPDREYFTVGIDIMAEDISEVYYTYASSTYPPDYQRYRLYTVDNAHWFYHEKREGDHWPLSEADITFSGSVALTEEEWQTFFTCLASGEVRKRTESLVDGDAGPWMYLYWNGDPSDYQEFTFESWEKAVDFENLCLKLTGAENQ